jgi:hypothetical protein
VLELAGDAAQCLLTPKLDVHFTEQLSFTDITPGLPTKEQGLLEPVFFFITTGVEDMHVIGDACTVAFTLVQRTNAGHIISSKTF